MSIRGSFHRAGSLVGEVDSFAPTPLTPIGASHLCRGLPAPSIHANRLGRLDQSPAPTCLIDLLGAVNQTAFLFSVIRIIRVIRGPLRKSVKSVDLQFAFIRVHSWLDQAHHEKRSTGHRRDRDPRLSRMALVRPCPEAAASGGPASSPTHSGKARGCRAFHTGEITARQTYACCAFRCVQASSVLRREPRS